LEKELNMNRCRKCILPEDFDGITLGETGLCDYCRDSEISSAVLSGMRSSAEAAVRKRLASSGSRRIVAAFSGGRDSSYVLKYLRESFDAHILALTVDNGYLSPTAIENCRRITTALGIEHSVYKPPAAAINSVYRASAQPGLHSNASLLRASGICNSCIRVVDTKIIQVASEFQADVVAWGYVEGQSAVPQGVLEYSVEASLPFRRQFLNRFGTGISQEARDLFQLAAKKDFAFLLLCPMVYLRPREEEINATLETLGWVAPTDTGAFSSNCRLNDFGIYQHLSQHGRHPYLFKLAGMVRRGQLSRETALAKLSSSPDEETVEKIQRELHEKK
jgi:hypothetical protein